MIISFDKNTILKFIREAFDTSSMRLSTTQIVACSFGDLFDLHTKIAQISDFTYLPRTNLKFDHVDDEILTDKSSHGKQHTQSGVDDDKSIEMSEIRP